MWLTFIIRFPSILKILLGMRWHRCIYVESTLPLGFALNFCTFYSLPPIPLSEPVLCRFVMVLVTQGVSASSIKAYLSAVRFMYISHFSVDPKLSDVSLLHYTLLGIKCSQGASQASIPLHQQLPLPWL